MFAHVGNMYATLQARLVAQHISAAQRIVALTGAGISTAAGVPDFRGPSGIYVARAYPEDVFDIDVFVADPTGFYAFARDFIALNEQIVPSHAHRFLAQLEKTGRLKAVVTQNIDGLHQKAGQRTVVEVHGGFTTSVCLSCERRCPTAESTDVILRGEIPHCGACGGLIKPDIVFFGEAVKDLDLATRLVQDSDLLVVIGSSLTVYPAAGLPAQAGGQVVVVAQGSVTVTPGAFRVEADIDRFFEQVEAELGGTGLPRLRVAGTA
jgi:NAD-dependent deacetylase